jgi:hypothetical protein
VEEKYKEGKAAKDGTVWENWIGNDKSQQMGLLPSLATELKEDGVMPAAVQKVVPSVGADANLNHFGDDMQGPVTANGEEPPFPPGFGPVPQFSTVVAVAPAPTMAPAAAEIDPTKVKIQKVSRKVGAGPDQVTSVLGKKGDREQEDKAPAEVEIEGDGKEQKKKIKGTAEDEEGEVHGVDGGMEATGIGAPGKLVGAKDGACQEP